MAGEKAQPVGTEEYYADGQPCVSFDAAAGLAVRSALKNVSACKPDPSALIEIVNPRTGRRCGIWIAAFNRD